MKRIFILFCFLLIHLSAQAATITAQVDRNPVQVNESFTLTFSANSSVDDDPDFSPLEKDFDILSRSSGSNIRIINGNYSRSTQWTLTVIPKREGALTIPAISFGKDQSSAISIHVKAVDNTATPAGADVFLEMEASRKQSWVQAQIIITVRLLSALNISQFGLSPLKISDLDTVVEQLGKDKQYQTHHNNRAYLVVERKYALFPQKAGQLHIPVQTGEVEIASRRRSSFFDPLPSRGKNKRVRSPALDITVTPIPASFKNRQWLAASKLQLREEWSPNPPIFKVGEPVTRSISLIAEGVPAAQLPELQKYSLPGIKLYPDQPNLNDAKQSDGIIGRRVEKVALMPTKPGDIRLPEIKIPWWNTETEKLEYARIPSRTVKILPGVINNNTALTNIPAMPQTTTPTNITVGEIINGKKTAFTCWPWLSLVLASGWLLTLLLWFKQHRKQRREKTGIQKKAEASDKQLQKNVIHACKDNDPHVCKTALIEWGRRQFSDANINTLGDIVEQSHELLRSEIIKLNRALYSQKSEPWNAQPLLEAFKLWKNSADKTEQRPSRLQPLNPD